MWSDFQNQNFVEEPDPEPNSGFHLYAEREPRQF
jgi:hypothetical protein